MKLSLKRVAYLTYFVALAMTFAVLYYGSYYYALKYMTSDNIITKDKLQEDNPAVDYMNREQDLNEVNAEQENIISNRTNYADESSNKDTDELQMETMTPPVEVLGYNRQQLIDYLTTYMSKNKDETLVNIQLVSFSTDSVVVRKTVRTIEKTYNYYVLVENGMISVYKADKETKYFDTGIHLSEVEEKERQKLTDGFYVEDIRELYNYLESITS